MHHSPATTSLDVERPALWWAGLRKLKACFAGVPREEDRIFLFLDLNSSTMLAEELGHIRYSELLKSCFADLALSVKKYKATVYQYVGDEAVLSWGGHLPAEGVALFFDFENRLCKRASFYKNKFGCVPTFKASIHGGKVAVTRLGVFRQHKVYHGDVLNACARMLEVCRKIGSRLIVSERVANLLEVSDPFIIHWRGSMEWRGKSGSHDLYTVNPY
ncbi:MAG: adenylate/guanylate cyclase domain-containing protein [Bacteroidota bacterium]